MNTIQKFQNLLKPLFQFEASDLNFEICRISNYKRDRINKFIIKDKLFIIKELEPRGLLIVYVNGQSILTPKICEHIVDICYIEPKFKKLMEV